MMLGARKGFASGGSATINVSPPSFTGANSSIPALTPSQASAYPSMPTATAIAQPSLTPQPFSSQISTAPSLGALSGNGSNPNIASVNTMGVPSGSPRAPTTVPNAAFTPPTAPPATNSGSGTQTPIGLPNDPSVQLYGMQNGTYTPVYGTAGNYTTGNPSYGQVASPYTGNIYSSGFSNPSLSNPSQFSLAATGSKRGGKIQGFAPGGIPTSEALDPWYTRAEERGMLHPEGLIASTGAGRTDVHNINVPSGAYVVPADVVSGLGEGNTLAGSSVIDRMMHSNPYGIQGGGRHAGSGPPRAPAPYREPAFNENTLQQPVKKGGAVGKAKGGAASVPPPKPYNLTQNSFVPVTQDDLVAALQGEKALQPMGGKAISDQPLPPAVQGKTKAAPAPAPNYPPIEDIAPSDRPNYGGYAKGGQAKPHGEATPIIIAGGEFLLHPETIIKKFGSLEKGHAALDAFVVKVRQKTAKTMLKLPGPKGASKK